MESAPHKKGENDIKGIFESLGLEKVNPVKQNNNNNSNINNNNSNINNNNSNINDNNKNSYENSKNLNDENNENNNRNLFYDKSNSPLPPLIISEDKCPFQSNPNRISSLSQNLSPNIDKLKDNNLKE